MTISKTIRLYEFEELGKSIQDSVISSYIQDLPGWWSDDTEERIQNEAKAIGIKNFDFTWSGFWSQGDGLSFTGSLDFKTWLYILQQHFPNWATDDVNESNGYKKLGESLSNIVMMKENNRIEWGDCLIERTMNLYCHENTVRVSEPDSALGWDERRGYPSDNERMDQFGDKAQKYLEAWKNELCQRWYSELLAAYESFTDRENIVEDLSSKELLFTSSGMIIDEAELV